MKIEQLIAYHCAPALSGIKPANLISVPDHAASRTTEYACRFNRQCNRCGVYFMHIPRPEGRPLLLVYNRRLLERTLACPKVRQMLSEQGYTDSSLEAVLGRLKQRLSVSADFPHEVGLFLGYPPEDVAGFIDNRGENYKLCGYWKVYGNADRAKSLFEQYTKCRLHCVRRLQQGTSLSALCQTAV